MEYGLKVAVLLSQNGFQKTTTAHYMVNSVRSFNFVDYMQKAISQSTSIKMNSLLTETQLLKLGLTPVPIVPKFVDIVVNGISNRLLIWKY